MRLRGTYRSASSCFAGIVPARPSAAALGTYGHRVRASVSLLDACKPTVYGIERSSHARFRTMVRFALFISAMECQRSVSRFRAFA